MEELHGRTINKYGKETLQKALEGVVNETDIAMIQKGGKKINDIYIEVGIKNRSHFSIAYKKQYGHSPALSVN